MNVQELRFDTEAMIMGLRPWVETESPGFDVAAVNKLIDLAAYDLATLGASIERIPGRFGFGDSLRATLSDQRNSIREPGILVCCHADTIHPLGSLQTMPYRREGNKLFGVGVQRTKAGIYLCLEALRQLIASGWQKQLPVTVLIVPDKELGCPTSRELIEATARQSRFVLVAEPAAANGGLVLGRHAVSRFKLDVKVDTVHELKSPGASPAGAASPTGSPIAEMARYILDIESMTTDDCSFRVGSIQSGQWANFAEKCSAEVISQATTPSSVVEAGNRIFAMNSSSQETGLHVNRSVVLPLWEPNEACKNLFRVAVDAGELLGTELDASVAGNGSIGNITGAMGVATLDGLGACGSDVYGLQSNRTRSEYVEIDSLVQRARLIAALLSALK